MELPCRHPYDPPWNLIWLMVAAGFAMPGLMCLRLVSCGVALAVGAVPVLLALMLTVRRLVFPRFLELDQDALSVPMGFLRVRATRIPYAEVEWTRETAHFSAAVLSLRTRERAGEVISSFLPDAASYASVRDFLHSRLKKMAPVPRPRQPGDPRDYCLQCSYPGFGNVCDSEGRVFWQTAGQEERTRARYPYGLFRLPDFVVSDSGKQELFRIKRIRRLPMARFVMTQKGVPVGTIIQKSLFLNRYALDFAGGEKWNFRMPLFTVFFKGVSEAGGKVLVRLWSHNVWYVRVDAGCDTPELLAALAFIHRERLRCN